MLKLFLNTTDNFLTNRVKTIFEKTEKDYLQTHQELNVLDELKKIQSNPLGCTLGSNSKFETSVKIQLKIILGIFFVLIPLLGFSVLTYMTNTEITYALLLTVVVTYLVSSRMDEIINRYVQSRSIATTY